MTSTALLHCRTCGSTIVDTVNDGVFCDGECGLCERARYESQPEIKANLIELIEAAECVTGNLENGQDLDCALRYLDRLTKEIQPKLTRWP
jgi:hypothetical protein